VRSLEEDDVQPQESGEATYERNVKDVHAENLPPGAAARSGTCEA
jgi:hypothetical protein